MTNAPRSTVEVNTWDFLREPMIAPTGFREYDARWKYPDEINLPGMQALGLGIGTQMHALGIPPHIAVGNDYRDYSLAIKYALMTGLAIWTCPPWPWSRPRIIQMAGRV